MMGKYLVGRLAECPWQGLGASGPPTVAGAGPSSTQQYRVAWCPGATRSSAGSLASTG